MPYSQRQMIEKPISMRTQYNPAGPVILASLLFAAVLLMVDVVLGRAGPHAFAGHRLGGLAALTLLLIVFHLVAYFLAGLLTAHGTRTVWSGVLAAVAAALISGVCARLVTDAPFTFARQMRVRAYGIPGASLLAHSFTLLIIALALSALTAAVFGALGALAGRGPALVVSVP